MATDKAEARRQAAAFMSTLNSARQRLALYPPEHPQVKEAVGEVLRCVEPMHVDSPSFTVSIMGEELFLNGRLLPEESRNHNELMAQLTERKLTNLSLDRGITPEELTEFVRWSTAKPEEISAAGGWGKVLAEAGVTHLAVDRQVALDDMWDQQGGGNERFRVSREVYRKTINAALSAYMDAKSHQSVNVEMVDGVVQLLVSSVVGNDDMMKALSQIRGYDEYTLSHSVNVAVLTLLMGSKLKMPGPLLHRLGTAALLHDIGKTQVSEDIVNKDGKLSSDEWEQMQSHALRGAQMLAEQEHMDQLAIVVASEHHAREDLTGYPRFHAYKKLHTMSKIVAVVDTYDALTSDRSYRKSETPDEAMKLIIEGSGTHFSAPIVKVFAQLTGMYPVGSVVEMDTGELGVVYKPNTDDIYRPQVKLFSATDESIAEYKLVDVAEREEDGSYPRTIRRSVDPSECQVDISDFL